MENQMNTGQGLDIRSIAPKLLEMGYKPKDIMTALDTASKMGLVTPTKTPAEKIADMKLQQTVREENNQNSLQATQLQTKANELGAAGKNEYLEGAVGPNAIARGYSSGMFEIPQNIKTLWTGGKQNFIASVKQLTDQETMNTLLNLKQAGGTLGALSDSERQMLQDAASKINNWAVKDGEGKITGYNASEDDFKVELSRLQGLAQTAADRATAKVTPTENTQQAQATGPTFQGLTQWIQSNPQNPNAIKAAEAIKSGKLTQDNFGTVFGGSTQQPSQPVNNNNDPLGLGF